MPATKDSAPAIAEMVRARLMARSGTKRFLMGVQMFHSTRLFERIY
jgi:hypothetical protein